MTRSMWLVALTVCLALAAGIWRAFEPAGDSNLPVAALSPEQAAVERMLERTLRESSTGEEAPSTMPAPSGDSPLPAVSPPQAMPSEREVSTDSLPEGYSLGTYRGAMQRAPRTGLHVAEPAANPDWLESASTHDAILDQAARAGRTYTFAVLRVAPGTDLQALDRSLLALGSRIEGSTGEYVRVRVPSDRGRLESIAGLAGVLGMGAVPPGIKADEAFVQEMLSRPAGEQVPVYITLIAPDPAGEWRRALTELGVVVGAYDPDLRSYTANMPAAALAPVLAGDYVLSVEPIPTVTVNHASAVPVMGVDGLRRYDPVTGRFSGLTGSGIAVGVLDTGLNTNHVDIAYGRRSICGASFVGGEDWELWLDIHGHGTHVFGTIAGAGRTYSSLAGIAPAVSHLRFAKVLSLSGSGIAEDVRRGMDYLARPTNCMWQGKLSDAVKPLIVNMSLARASLEFSGRGVGERKLDALVFAHSQLYVVAQANSATHGFSNYGTAKNSLAVGAVHDSGIIAEFSSQGPTADGRLAPNVVGTGIDLTSVRGGAARSGHRTLSGTSMASPSVAGVAALLMEARPEFRNQPALARARLMASAIRPNVHMEDRARLPRDNTEGPGAFQARYGLGLVSARTSVASLDDPAGWLIGSASSRPENDSYEYIDVEVPEDAGRLDIVLTWDEQPADTLTRSVLNNLDLWVDHGADCGEGACGEHASRSGVDNVEWLLIEAPAPGTYRIKVAPVEVYGESSTAAVAWKILRGEPTPNLEVSLEDTSIGGDSEYITLDVIVDASHYLASGTTVQLGCRSQIGHCSYLERAYRPERTRVFRHDATIGTENGVNSRERYRRAGSLIPPIPVGEVVAGEPRRVQLWFRRDSFHEEMEAVACVTASSWNATATGQCLGIGMDEPGAESIGGTPANDNFAASKRIEGATGEASADLLLASREPGEPRVLAGSRTLWYTWQAPSNGLFRFRLQEPDTGNPENADFTLFTGRGLANLDMLAEKKAGSEFTFSARADTVYSLRIRLDGWSVPLPLKLRWESADSRPSNDDFAYARLIEGVEGQIESTNNGATLEGTEFLGGLAASVWYEWTAPENGYWIFDVQHQELVVHVFEGARVNDLRLLSHAGRESRAYLVARGGQTYRIAVGANSADASPLDFNLHWRRITEDVLPGINHLFENATEIGGPEGRENLEVNGVYEGFVVEPEEPAVTGAGTRWWQWTAPADGQYTWRMDQSFTGTFGFRTSTAFRLTIFSGDALDNLELEGLLRSGGAALVLDATGGTRYWIAVGRSPDSTGHLPLLGFVKRPEEFTWGPTPPNDDRTAATPIASVAGSDNAALGYATKTSSEPSDLVGAGSVWWRWRAPTSGWQRFWVEGHPLSTVLGIYRDAQARMAIADSERTFLANGRVEVHLLATAGQSYDIRVASRSGLTLAVTGSRESLSATLRWEAVDVPAFLAYKGAVTLATDTTNPVSQGFHTPRSLAISDDGHYLFSSSANGIFAFLRDPESGELALAYRTPATVETSGHFENLWWNARDDRLLVADDRATYSIALPEEGAWLTSTEVTLNGGDSAFFTTSELSPDGRHIYGQDFGNQTISLQAYSIDSPAQWTRIQTVTATGPTDDSNLILPGTYAVVDMAFSPEGEYLYAAAENALLVFSRDSPSGRLELMKRIQRSNALDNPFSLLGDIKDLSLDGTHTMLYVSGRNISGRGHRRAGAEVAIAAFEIASDPSDPAYRGTFSRLAWQNNGEIFFNVQSHERRPGPFVNCRRLVPHADRAAVDVVCPNGFFVVQWNSEGNVLEATDGANSGSEDRFGSLLPYDHGGAFFNTYRQIAQSPDGAHIYVATDVASDGWGYADAIHIFERAIAMSPPERSMDAGGANTEPTEVAEPGDDMEGSAQTGMEVECYVGLLVRPGESCTYPGTADEFSVNARGRGSFLGRLAGIRIRINNETINGRVYDFLATHQGDGVWRIDRIAGMT